VDHKVADAEAVIGRMRDAGMGRNILTYNNVILEQSSATRAPF
jgi:hypothetical protein